MRLQFNKVIPGSVGVPSIDLWIVHVTTYFISPCCLV
jgi:hypothetical protein